MKRFFCRLHLRQRVQRNLGRLGLTALCAYGRVEPGLCCQPPSAPTRAEQKVVFYSWGNYFPDSVLKAFQEKTGIKVELVTFQSNEEALAKLEGSSQVRCDLILPSSFTLPLWIQSDLLQPFPSPEREALQEQIHPNFRLQDPSDPEQQYALPYFWSATGIGWCPSEPPCPKPTAWADLWGDKFRGKILLLEDSKELFAVTRQTFVHEGTEHTLPSFDDQAKRLSGLMRNARLYLPDDPQSAFLMGEVSVGILWSGTAKLAQLKKFPLEFIWPKEGALLWQDCFMLPKRSRNPEAAMELVNFLYKPEVSAQITRTTGFATTHRDLRHYLAPEEQTDSLWFPDAAHLAKARPLTLDLKQQQAEERCFQLLKLGLWSPQRVEPKDSDPPINPGKESSA